jgi:ATP-dependent Clp protease ATP-binding subunit ClpC
MRLMQMEDEMHKRVISQHEAIKSISKAVRRSRAGLKDPKRPTGCFIFAGPTGVGKTLLAKALAEFMFGDEDAIIQIDMSEYMEKHNVSRLVGAPPGYVGYEEGGQLTEKIRRRPYSVVLLDEIEKAHSDVLQHAPPGHGGRAPDRQLRPKRRLPQHDPDHDLQHPVPRRSRTSRRFGFRKTSEEITYEKMKEGLMKELDRHFRPEFLNRVTEVVVFKALTQEDMKEIIDIELKDVRERLLQRGLDLQLTDAAKEYVIEKGTNLDFGARPLKRALERHIEDPLSEEILKGSYEDKNSISVRVKDDHLYFHAMKRKDKAASEEETEESESESEEAVEKA